MTILAHKIFTRKRAMKRVDEIMFRWEKLGYNKPNDVPPTDKDISEYLQLMSGLGLKIKYKFMNKLKKVV